MRRRAVIAPIVLLAGALLAWRRRRARAARTPLGPSPRPTPPRVSGAPAPAAPLAAVPPPPADSCFLSVPWTLAAAPADRAELTIRFACDERLELDRVDAQETPTQVFVTVLLRRRGAAAPDSSAGEPQEHETTVALSGPLGVRELVHAPDDPTRSDVLHAAAGGEPSAPPAYP